MREIIQAGIQKGISASAFSAGWLRRRRHQHVVVVGITGSVGKTTTKRVAAHILSTFGPCLSTPGTENLRETAAALMRRLTGEHRYCVIEMSEARPGYLKPIVWMTRPSIAVITAIGRDHYSAFHSIDAIAAETAKLVSGLPPDGIAVLNADDERVRRIGESCGRRVIWVGAAECAHIRLLEATSSWPQTLTLKIASPNGIQQIQTRLHGRHLATSVLSALGVAMALDLPLGEAIAALETVEPEEGRMQEVVTPGNVVFIRDDFKAPHWALDTALAHLGEARATRKFLVLGTVSDSPESPSRRYARLARAAKVIADQVIVVGPDAEKALKARKDPDDDSIRAFLDLRSANEFLKQELRSGDFILLKGTNKQDHLQRLVIDRSQPVQCWRPACGLQFFCRRCRHLFANDVRMETAVMDSDTPSQPLDMGTPPALIIAGLGNPGDRYVDTPHNAGHIMVDQLARLQRADWKSIPEGAIAWTAAGSGPLLLFKVGSVMNQSGPSVHAILERYQLSPERLVVMHDDADLGFCELKRAQGSSDAGHNGLRSISRALGTAGYHRIRVGIRTAGDESKARDLVLRPFSASQIAALHEASDEAMKLLEPLLSTVRIPVSETPNRRLP